MKKKNILIDKFNKKDYTIEKKIFGKNYNLLSLNGKKLSSSLKFLKKIDGVLAWHENTFDKKILDQLKNCKIITRVGVGFNNIDLSHAKKKNIKVCNVPDYGINDVADHAMTFLLVLCKKINSYSEDVRKKLNWKWGDYKKLKRIQNTTLGILGCGRIGSAVALRAKSFGMNVIFYDPYVTSGHEKTLSIKRQENLKNFLGEIDVLSIHTPLTEITNNMVNDSFVKKMKKGVIIINTARGPILNKETIYRFLKNGHIGGVGLDVYENEPPLKNDKLYKSWRKSLKNFNHNILFTPHSAFLNNESYIELRQKAAINIKNFFEKKIVKNQVN